MSASETPHTVSFDQIEKSFFGVKVLKGVSFGVEAGRIVGLVGENGAGKSTLMNVLGGNLQPDSGSLRVSGQPYAPKHPNDAGAAGIAFVHQELNLFPNLSIGENLFLTAFPLVGGGVPWIDRRALGSRTAELLLQVGLDHSPDTLVEQLSTGERQLVEIARAIGAQARLIILDEPTTSLSVRECERLFALLNRLRERGIAMIYISHVLGDVLRLCDDVVILRDGEVVGGGLKKEFTHDRLVSLMVGRQLNQLYPERCPAQRQGGKTSNASPQSSLSPQRGEGRGEGWENTGTPVTGECSGQAHPSPLTPLPVEGRGEAALCLEVHSLSQPGVVHDISFRLAAGEVLGVSGLMGAGR